MESWKVHDTNPFPDTEIGETVVEKTRTEEAISVLEASKQARVNDAGLFPPHMAEKLEAGPEKKKFSTRPVTNVLNARMFGLENPERLIGPKVVESNTDHAGPDAELVGSNVMPYKEKALDTGEVAAKN